MTSLALLVSATMAWQGLAADTLRDLARRLPESQLVLEARARPLALRDAVSASLERSVATPAAGAAELDIARRLAAAHAAAWNDSFLVREVARFSAWPAPVRAAKVRADGDRRAGAEAWSRDGVGAALLLWRRALGRATAIPDTAGMAAALGNIGVTLLEEGRLDSAAACLERALRFAVAVGDRRVEANAIASLAAILEERGDLAAARAGYAHALELRGRLGDSRGLAADHNNLGLVAQRAGDLAEARRSFETALALNRRDGRDGPAATNLVNLAGLAALDGDFARAESMYRDALAAWRARGEWAEAAAAQHGLGQLELRRGDYPAARAALREALSTYDRTGPLGPRLAVRRDLAGAAAAAGDLQAALDELRRAAAVADSGRATARTRAGIAMARGDLAVQLNAMAEAERHYALAAGLYRRAADPSGEAAAHEGLGQVLIERGEFRRAESLFSASLRTQEATGDRRAAGLSRLSLGVAAARRGDMALAVGRLTGAAADLERAGDPVSAAAALGELAGVAARSDRPAVAESLYLAALDRLGGRPAPEVTWRLHAGLGLARRTRGATDLAARSLRASLSDIERTAGTLLTTERRSGYRADKAEVYAHLALLEQARARQGAAFDAAERLRSRDMIEMLGRGRLSAPADTAADLLVRAQDLRRHIGELMSDVERAAGPSGELRGPDLTRRAAGEREALARAEEAYAELVLEMRERTPRQAELLSPTVPGWRDVAARLDQATAFLSYLVSDSGSLAFVVSADSMAVIDLRVGRRDLARLVTLARGTLERRGAGRADTLWRAPLRRLHALLVAPLDSAGALRGMTRLVVAPYGELHYLPFAALLDGRNGDRYMAERFELELTPSASAWLLVGERVPVRRTSGLSAYAPRPDALPASAQEVAAVARLVGDAAVRTGTAATESAFRAEAARRRVLHLATYGVLNSRNPLFSYVELAPDSTHDGRLEVHEVLGLSLAAELVVLSACQTALGSGLLADVPAGDDWVGLTRAFLLAGAARVVASLWAVDDRATAVLMERTYRNMADGRAAPAALTAAQRELLAAPATAHPFYWSGFVAIGGARRTESDR